MFTWSMDSLPPTGGISSYTGAYKIDLSDYSPSLWSFNQSSSITNNECSNWLSINGSCVWGTRTYARRALAYLVHQ